MLPAIKLLSKIYNLLKKKATNHLNLSFFFVLCSSENFLLELTVHYWGMKFRKEYQLMNSKILRIHRCRTL